MRAWGQSPEEEEGGSDQAEAEEADEDVPGHLDPDPQLHVVTEHRHQAPEWERGHTEKLNYD